MIRAMQNGEIEFPRGIIAEELASIQAVSRSYGYKYEAIKDKTDDCFDALAMVTYQYCYEKIINGQIFTARRPSERIPIDREHSVAIPTRTQERMFADFDPSRIVSRNDI